MENGCQTENCAGYSFSLPIYSPNDNLRLVQKKWRFFQVLRQTTISTSTEINIIRFSTEVQMFEKHERENID